MRTTVRSSTFVMCLFFALNLVVSGVATEASEAERHLVVPLGATGTIESGFYGSIDVYGELVADDNLVIAVDTLVIHEGGVLRALAMPTGDFAVSPRAFAHSGENGSTIAIEARQIVIKSGGHIMAGHGGHGGDAVGAEIAEGGAGGTGGFIVLTSHEVTVEGGLWPGRGGDGGDAIVRHDNNPTALAIGGKGGNSGRAFVNGIQQDTPGLPPELYAQAMVANPEIESLLPTPEIPGTPLPPFPPSLPDLLPVPPLGDAPSIPNFPVPAAGLPGGTGMYRPTCVRPSGENGSPGVDGGRGGSACASAEGDDGEPGRFGTLKGGQGGAGVSAVGGQAKGGEGGAGINRGGDGGAAEASGKGGRGGNGGWSTIAGGDGGAGGSGTGGSATGGNAGPGGCEGGIGGDASAIGVGNAGGSGGYGVFTNGTPGAPGAAFLGNANAGLAGSSLGVCS